MARTAEGSQRTLPAIPFVVLHDSVPARMALRLIEKAVHYGWHDAQAERDLARGRNALLSAKWRSTAALDADLIRHRRAAFAWLAHNATPPSHELHDNDEEIVLRGRSDIL